MKNTVAVYGLLLFISLACIGGSYFIPDSYIARGIAIDCRLTKHIVEELGIAGLIGFILAITIERLSAAEFRKLAEEERDKIKQDVFHYVYGRHIPEAIRQEIDSQLLTAKFLRKNHSLVFKLTPIEDPVSKEKLILSDCTLTYEIHNLTPRDEVFSLQHAIDKSPGNSLLEHVKFTRVKVDNSESPIDWDEHALKKRQTDEGYQIALTPKNEIIVRREQPAQVLVKYQGVRNLKGGRINFTFTNYTCDIALRVHVPGREVRISAEAFSPHALTATEGVHDPEAGIYDWTLKRPLLSNQGICISWNPASPEDETNLHDRAVSGSPTGAKI